MVSPLKVLGYCLLFTFASCASTSSIKDLPQLKQENFQSLNFYQYGIRTLNVDVIDSRSSKNKSNSQELENLVKNIYSSAIGKHGTKIKGETSNSLIVKIQEVLPESEKETKTNCVMLTQMINLGDKHWIQGVSEGCYEYRNTFFNFSMGGNISKAYESAIKTSFELIDKKLSELLRKK